MELWRENRIKAHAQTYAEKDFITKNVTYEAKELDFKMHLVCHTSDDCRIWLSEYDSVIDELRKGIGSTYLPQGPLLGPEKGILPKGIY